MVKYYFVTGTDTDVGKTYVTVGLLKLFKNQGFSTVGIKPVASGCDDLSNGLRNNDVLLLQNHATVQLPYELINPIAFKMPIAPHIAASKSNISLTAEILVSGCQAALSESSEIVIIEGAGGWYAPLNINQTMADFVKQLGLEVILVVGIRLGCLNHALLTYQAILNDKITLKGWIANCIDSKMDFIDENIQTLSNKIKAPFLGKVPFGGLAENFIDIISLI